MAGGDGLVSPFVAEAVEEGAGGQDDAGGGELAVSEVESGDGAVGGHSDAEDGVFDERQVRLSPDHGLHELRVEVFADVGAGGLDGGAFAGADAADVGEGVVRGDAHLAAEGVDFAGHVALRGAADAAVAGEVADAIEPHGDAGGADAHSRGGEGGLDSGVSGSYHDDVVLVHDSIVKLLEGGIEIHSRLPARVWVGVNLGEIELIGSPLGVLR